MTPLTEAIPDQPGSRMTPAEYGASRAGLWTAAGVLVTDRDGRVLVQHVDYRDTLLLPGGAVDAGESPSTAAAREMDEELGVETRPTRGLVVDWIPANTPGFEPEMRFPGEIVYVFDGGTWSPERIASVRLPAQEITGIRFVEPGDLARVMEAGDARRVLAALRARVEGQAPTLLERGRPAEPGALDRLGVLCAPRPREHGAWRTGPVPQDLAVRDTRCWLLAPDGRALALVDREHGTVSLPTPEQVPPGHVDGPLAPLGHLHDENAPWLHLRTVGRLGPGATAPGGRYAALLATPEQIRELTDWGPDGPAQIAAVHEARRLRGLPEPLRGPVTELA
ncbi:NUDIX domain-containing protein [Streptomyces sp. BI20]|uniref:NUDIX domain-containing protein n=1 Tax=Streptomyces sp. BI20 TaxID=3403460 RepID=UPI003C720FE9